MKSISPFFEKQKTSISWILAILGTLAIVGTSCSSNTNTEDPKPSPMEKAKVPFTFIGEVQTVTPIEGGEIHDTNRSVWQISFAIKDVLSSEQQDEKLQEVSLWVHSVVRIFQVPVEEMKGKVFLITYQDGFSNPYQGNINNLEVREEKERVDTNGTLD